MGCRLTEGKVGRGEGRERGGAGRGGGKERGMGRQGERGTVQGEGEAGRVRGPLSDYGW